jgi:hypothetical protein
MRLWITICCLTLYKTVPAQNLNLTSFQHEMRWLDETRFPPVVKYPAVSDSLLEYAAFTLARKFNAENYSRPEQIDYRLIDMFGKPKMKSPNQTVKEKDFQASILSFLTRATSGNEVYWQMKVEVRQQGKTVYHRETNHELLTFEPGIRWFDEAGFQEHFKVLFDELLELGPPLAKKYVIGKGIDYAELLKTDGLSWEVDRKSNLAGFGMPSFGPYTTLDAGKLDTAVIRSKTKKRVGETEVGISTDGLIFDQFKTVDFSQNTFCFLWLGSGQDTTKAAFSIGIRSRETSRTFLSDLLSKDDEFTPSGSSMYRRNINGVIRTDSLSWEFVLQNYQTDGSISGGYLLQGGNYYPLKITRQGAHRKGVIVATKEGEYLASLEYSLSSTQMRIRKSIDPHTANAIATLYAVLMSTKNVE